MLLVSQNGKKSWGLKYYNSHNLLGKKSPILDRNAKTLILPVLINVNLENNPSPNTQLANKQESNEADKESINNVFSY